MTVMHNPDTSLSVMYWTDHFGHDNEIAHCSLDKSTRDNLARKLQDGVSMQHIMDDIRTHGIDNDPRALLIDRVDLHNIKRDYNIDYCTKLHNDDATSIKLWVQKMGELKEDSPVLMFKNQGYYHAKLHDDDFILILMTHFQANQILKFGCEKLCVDDTHGTNGYK
ncbi:uncharacterized protein LOC120354437 [Nilaparvata lugens]|uniref:uncharacterized protein LOC120354437 n=1 Tax=Nilaparvata lugens TaxID=108931 RepID=UPI00193E56E6|nr:uncharacterized protein LOC120354437 [Nilaparvata lugens]